MKKVQLIPGLAAMGIMLATSSAFGAVTITTVRNGFVLDNPPGVAMSADCPPGTLVVGGGWYADTTVVVIGSSLPYVDLPFSSGWSFSAGNNSQTPQYVEVFARCASGLPAGSTVTSVRTWMDAIPAQSVASVDAYCPSGSIATAAGFTKHAQRVVAVNVYLGSSGTSSHVSFNNPSSMGLSNPGAGFALCLSAGPGASMSQWFAPGSTNSGDGWSMESGMSCPAGTLVTSGGYSFNNTVGEPFYQNSDNAYPNGWTIWTSINLSGWPNAMAFCATIP
jgi:hypothetical protein